MSILGNIALTEDPGSSVTSGQVISHNTFDSRLYRTYNGLSYQTIRELRTDPTIQLARWAVLAPMVHTPWMYVSQNDLATREMINYVEKAYTPLRDFYLQQAVFGSLDYGWQPFEVIYKPEAGYIYPQMFKSLIHDYTDILVYINTGGFAGFANRAGYAKDEVRILEKYALLNNFEVEGTDWYGYTVFKSLLKICNAWNDVQDAASRYDRKIAGANWVVYYPVGKTLYSGQTTSNDKIAQELLNTLESSGCIAIPDEIQSFLEDDLDRDTRGKWRIELIEAKSSSSSNFIDRQKYLDALKMRAFGLTERSVLEGSHGTKAEADVHGDVSLSIVDSRHRLLVSQLNNSLAYAMKLNFGEKYMYAVKVQPAPLVDSQFKTIKEIYTRIISSPEILLKEYEKLDLVALRSEIGLPTISIEGDL